MINSRSYTLRACGLSILKRPRSVQGKFRDLVGYLRRWELHRPWLFSQHSRGEKGVNCNTIARTYQLICFEAHCGPMVGM